MSSGNESLNVTVDTDICQGHGRCFKTAPDVFEADDEGFARVKLPVVGSDQREAAERAAQLCPEMAITIKPVS